MFHRELADLTALRQAWRRTGDPMRPTWIARASAVDQRPGRRGEPLVRRGSGTATITAFTPPASGTPVMLALLGDEVWYSQQDPGRVVEPDPAAAAGQTAEVTTGSQAATPACSKPPPLAPTAVTVTGGPASWTGRSYPTALDKLGWKIYDMPETSAPWGIFGGQDLAGRPGPPRAGQGGSVRSGRLPDLSPMTIRS